MSRLEELPPTEPEIQKEEEDTSKPLPVTPLVKNLGTGQTNAYNNETTTTEAVTIDQSRGKCCAVRARGVMAVTAFFGVVVVFMMKINLQLVLDAMVNVKTGTLSDEYEEIPCPEEATEAETREGEFDWDRKTRKLLFSMVLCGSVVGNLLGGRLADTLGGKRVFGFGVLLSSLFLMLNPYLARLQLEALMAARVLEGLGQGMAFPAVNAMLVRWIPRSERSFFAALIYSGLYFGYVGGIAASTRILNDHVWGGWPTCFYVFGASGAIWAGMWLMLVYDLPADHPRISRVELEYIERNCDVTTLTTSKCFPTEMLMSLPVLSLIVVNCGTNFGFLMVNQLQMIWKGILNPFDENGLLMATPYIVASVISMVSAYGTDYVVSQRNVHITVARKMAQAFGSIGPAAGIFAAAAVGCDRFWIRFGLHGAICLAGFMSFGSAIAPVDMAPSFAGTVTGCVCAVGDIVGLLVYLVVVEIPGKTPLDRWTEMLFLTGAIYVCTYLVYLALGSSEIQSWGVEVPAEEINSKRIELYAAVRTEDVDATARDLYLEESSLANTYEKITAGPKGTFSQEKAPVPLEKRSPQKTTEEISLCPSETPTDASGENAIYSSPK